jgi:signal transduction histidine kinase
MRRPPVVHGSEATMSHKSNPAPLDDSNGFCQHYFDALPGIVSVQDRDLRIVQCNDFLRDSFGDPEGRHCFEVLKGRREKCLDCPVEETFRTGKEQRAESVVTTRAGDEMPVMVYTSPIKNETGEVVRVLKLAADMSDVKRLQGKLFRAQQRLNQFFNEVPCYVSVQNRELKLVAANRRFKEDFGDDVGDYCYKVYKHRSEPCLVCPVAQTFEDGQSHQSEEVVTSMSGEQYNVLVHTSPIRDEKGVIKHVVEMSTNITPLRELQTQLESTGLLITSISHSIKGLLQGMDGGMYLVNSGLKTENKQRIEKGWEMVSRNVDRIRGTVMNILYHAKKREPDWEQVSAAGLAEEVYTLAENQASQHGIVFKREIDKSAGSLEADPLAIRSLLINLLENSIDACRVDMDKTDHRVTLSAKGSDDEIHFSVSDNGIGMDREAREKVFSLFFSSKGTEGTGLGLFVANSIAKAHGGTIEVESEVDRGTRFTVRLPRKRTTGEAFEL